jgi:hypothetical protein
MPIKSPMFLFVPLASSLRDRTVASSHDAA